MRRWQQKLFHWHRSSRKLVTGSCLICWETCYEQLDLCTACIIKLRPHQTLCVICAEPLQHIKQIQCRSCTKRRPAFTRVYTAYLYQPPLRQLIVNFKYQQQRTAGYLLLDLLHQTYQNTPQDYDVLLVLPEQKERTKIRGYHAPSWLALRLGWLIGVPWRKQWLKRIKNIPSQQGLERKLRWRNPKGAFQADAQVQGRNLLLLDDVVTTGASVHWAAVELLAQGANRVDVLSCAKTPFSAKK